MTSAADLMGQRVLFGKQVKKHTALSYTWVWSLSGEVVGVTPIGRLRVTHLMFNKTGEMFKNTYNDVTTLTVRESREVIARQGK